jgi:hypothetical protein
MATNRDLLKEAIADAKTVKETAIANAKAALEEAFTPYLKEKFSAKLQEMDELDEDENMYEEAENVNEEEVTLDELLAELEENEEIYEAKEEKESEEEMSIEDMDEDDLKSFIEDIIKDMVAAGELEAGHEEEAEEAEEEENEEAEDEEVNIDELLNEEEMYEEEMYEEEMDEEINLEELLAELEEGTINEMASFYKIKPDVDQEKAKKALSIVKSKFKSGTAFYTILDKLENDGEVNYKELSQETGKDIATWNNPKTRSVLEKDGILAKYIDALSNPSAEAKGRGKKAEDKWKDIEDELSGLENEEGLQEALSTIESLQRELNEINLLNAKLLYTNKIFRNKSLTESQKIKVLTSFDKATTKKEAQLVYETLLEGLKTVSTTKSSIKESLSSASKSLGSSLSKPIIENDAFARMRELAGLKN